jgi:hypothetical protein
VIIVSDRICDFFSWFFRVGGITLWPFIIVRKETSEKTIRHEQIHIAQYNETLVIGFLLIYLFEWIWYLAILPDYDAKKAYKSIRFEKEAYANSKFPDYMKFRSHYNWRKY